MKLLDFRRMSFGINDLAKFNFFILVFFTFFGTSLPFQESNVDIYEAETSSVGNQILYLFLFFSSLLIFSKNYRLIFSFLRKEIFLSVFILFCLISLFWSDYPFISFKRSFQLITMFITIVNSIILIKPVDLLPTIKFVVTLYLLINVLSSIFISAAVDPSFGTWRGIEDQKNGLGQAGVYCFLISLLFYNQYLKVINKIHVYLISLMSATIIIMADSSTNMLIFLIILTSILVFQINKIFHALGIGKFLLKVVILLVISFIILIITFSGELVAIVPELFGKDMTFSGRVPFWSFLFFEIQQRPVLGYGFGTYWIMGSSIIDVFASEFGGFRVNQAHNGFIEIVLQLGFIGLTFFIILVFVTVSRIIKIQSNIAMLFLISILIINFTESTLFQPRGLTTLVFLSLYSLVARSYSSLN